MVSIVSTWSPFVWFELKSLAWFDFWLPRRQLCLTSWFPERSVSVGVCYISTKFQAGSFFLYWQNSAFMTYNATVVVANLLYFYKHLKKMWQLSCTEGRRAGRKLIYCHNLKEDALGMWKMRWNECFKGDIKACLMHFKTFLHNTHTYPGTHLGLFPS